MIYMWFMIISLAIIWAIRWQSDIRIFPWPDWVYDFGYFSLVVTKKGWFLE